MCSLWSETEENQLCTPIWVNFLVGDSTEPCLLAREPPAPLTGTPDFVQNLSSAPVCEAESIKHPQLMLVAGLGMMLASPWLFVTTAVLYLERKRGSAWQNKSECTDEKEIPLRFKSRFDFDD